MDDVPWIYVAMIFLAFVSWIRGRIRDATDRRRARAAQRKAAEQSRSTTEVFNPYQAPAPPQPPSPPEIPGQTFREFFEEVQQRAEAESEYTDELDFELDDPEPEVKAEPPPIPGAMPTEIPEIEAAPPMQSRGKKRRSGRATSIALRKALTESEDLRTALILKEILDKPKALQES